MQLAWPVSAVAFPTAQLVQESAVAAEKRPTPQFAQSEAETEAYDPAEQPTQSAEASEPVAPTALPAAHGTHLLVGTAENWPEGQTVQPTAPAAL